MLQKQKPRPVAKAKKKDTDGVFVWDRRLNDNGIVEDGHVCRVCEYVTTVGFCSSLYAEYIARAVGESKIFFTGSVTSLRRHIGRGISAHMDKYLQHCESENIEPHELVLSLGAGHIK